MSARPASLLCALAVLAACRRERCEAVCERGEFREAAAVCRAELERRPSPRTGVLLARALINIGQDAEALALAERYRDGDERANAEQVLGTIYDRRGESARAREVLQSALDAHRKRGDHRQAARDCHALAGAYFREGRYREALIAFKTFDEEAQASGEPRLRAHALIGLANILTEIGDDRSAERLLDGAERELGDRFPADGAYVHLHQGALRSEQGLYGLARQALLLALKDAEVSGRSSVTEWARLWLCHVDREERKLDQAAVDCEAAARLIVPASQASWRTGVLYERARVAHALGRADEARGMLDAVAAGAAPEWQWRIALERGALDEERGDDAAAERDYEQAIAVIEQLRRDLKFDELKPWMLTQKREPYRALLDLQARQGRAEDAFYTMERMAARTLLDDYIAVPSERSESAAAASDNAWLRGSTLQQVLPRLHDSAANLPKHYRELAAALARTNALVYESGRTRAWLFVLRDGDLKVRALAASTEELGRQIEALVSRPDDAGAADALGASLLPDGALPRSRTLYVIPSGSMRAISFAALRRNGRLLLDDYDVAYVPNPMMLAALRSGAAREPSDAPVVLADPRGDLPAAATEARRVAATFAVPAWIGHDATVARFRSAGRASLLHLATHVEVRARGPMIALGDGEVGGVEILDWGVRPRLVVAAACGSSSSRDDEGAGALSALFLAGGSRAVLGTLRSVDDAVTAELVARFYDEGGMRAPVHALAAAQRSLAANEPPSRWSPFVIHGVDPRP